MPTSLANGADLKNQRIQNLGSPSAPNDAVTKSYVDAAAYGVDWKDSVRAVAVGNISLSAPGAVIDGVTLVAGNSVALIGQTNATQNGIYIWNGTSTALTRRADSDTSAEVTAGLTFTVTEGTTYGGKTYRLITPDPIVLGTTNLSFTDAGGAGPNYLPGNGLDLTGQTFSVKPKPSGGIIVDGTGVSVDTSTFTRKVALAVGDGTATSITVTHNLGTLDFSVALVETSTGSQWIPDVTARTVNTVTLSFGVAPAASAFRAIVIG